MLAVAVKAQPRYGIYYEEMCWRTLSNGDSSIVRFSLATTQTSSPTVLYYTNATGNTINVSGGGTLELCWCSAPVDVSNPPTFDPEGCIFLQPVPNPFVPSSQWTTGIGYQGFLTGVSSAAQISVSFDGSSITDWTFTPTNSFLKTPADSTYFRYQQGDGPKTLQIIATNVAGSDTLTCTR